MTNDKLCVIVVSMNFAQVVIFGASASTLLTLLVGACTYYAGREPLKERKP